MVDTPSPPSSPGTPELPVTPAAATPVTTPGPPRKDPYAKYAQQASATPPPSPPEGGEPQVRVIRDPYAKYSRDPAVRADAEARATARPDDPYAIYDPEHPGALLDTTEKPGILESILRGGAEGATFGADSYLGLDKEQRELSRKTNPWAHFTGELLGGLVPMAAAYLLPTGAGQVAGAARGATLLRELAGLVRAGMTPGEMASWGQALGQGAKLGATYGSLSGAGHADVKPEDSWLTAIEKRALGAAKSGVSGAVGGALLGMPIYAATRGAQGLGTMLYRALDENSPGLRGALVNTTKRLEWDRVSPQDIVDQIRTEFPAAAGPGDVRPDPNAPGRFIVARRYWGPNNNRQPWTADDVEHVVARRMAGETPADIASNWGRPGSDLHGTGTAITPTENAVRTISDELGQRYLNPTNIVDRVSMVRRGAGANTQMGMRVAAATPGEATAAAGEQLLERQVGAVQRFHQILDRFVGTPDYEAAAANHTNQLTSAGARLYGIAAQNERPFSLADIVQRWLSRTDIPDEAKAAISRFAPEAPQWQQNLAGVLRQPTMPATQVAPTAADRAAVSAAETHLANAQRAAEEAREHVLNWWYHVTNDTEGVFTTTEAPPHLRNLIENTQQAVNNASAGLKAAQEAANVPVSPPTPAGAFGNRNGPIGLPAFQTARARIRDTIDGSWQQTPQGLRLNSIGRALEGFYRDITQRVRQTNPDWAIANDAWGDGKAAADAMLEGSRMTTRLNAGSRQRMAEFDDAQQRATQATDALNTARRAITGQTRGTRVPNAQQLANATPEQMRALTQAQARLDAANSRMQLFRVGFARALSDQALNKGETHDIATQLLYPGAQQIIRRILGPADADAFLQSMRAEQAMYRTFRSQPQFGSQTTPLAQAIREDQRSPMLEAAMSNPVGWMNPLSWINPAIRLAREYGAETIRRARNEQLLMPDTGVLSTTDPIRQLEYLRAMQGLHMRRANWGNTTRLPLQAGQGSLAQTLPNRTPLTQRKPSYAERKP